MKRKVSDLKVAELKVELEKRGLESKGLKGVLVQRLQKALEDDGGNTSEIETIGDTASPKISRRSVGRQKRATESETEQSSETYQEDEKEQILDLQPEAVTEKSDETNGVSVAETDTSALDVEVATEQNEAVEQIDEVLSDADESAQNEDFGDSTPTRDEEDDAPAPLYDHGDEYPPLEGEQVEMVSTEEVSLSEENIQESGNDFRDYEDPEQIEEEHEIMEEEDTGEEITTNVAVEQVEEVMAENVESESFVSAVEEQVVETGDAEEAMETEDTMTITKEIVEKPENVIEATEVEEDEKTATDEKIKSETNGKEEVVVSTEVDVLDMLDYDLEITGDQNNINTPSYDRSAKISESEAGDGKKTTKTDEETTSQDRKSSSRQGSDSQKKPSSSSSDLSKTGSQPSSKSSSAPTSKDGGKSTTGSKRENAGSSSTSKKEDVNKNLWISGLSQTTRASELKSAFSRYGKVIGAKVVTNVKSPGSRCYGYVTMSTVEAASKCILHLNNTDMHGRMITVEIAKSDPSASSSKKQSTSTSGGSAKKEALDSKTTSANSKGKDSDSKAGSSTSSRRQSSTTQSTKDVSGDKGKSESEKKPAAESKSREINSSNRKADDAKKTGHSKSPVRDRSRAERTSTSGPRTGDKRRTPPPPRNRSASSRAAPGYNKDEPERKRPRQPDAADRKVVMDSHKGELRVNVSRTTGRYTERAARWQATNEPKPKPLLSLRRSTSPPIRRRSISPMRGSILSRTGSGRGRGGRGGRGGLISRQSATYEDRNTGRAGNRNRGILSFNQIRAQQRDRDRTRGGGNRGGLARGELQADRERLRREREERDRLRLERERLEKERRQLEKDRQERARLEAERLRLEQERKRELERIEREKAEMRRLQEITRYEVEQRQRAIKRTYDDDNTGHRSNRSSNRDSAFDSKRSLVSDREVRTENRHGDREDRRGYGDYNSRDTSRNGPAQPSPPGTSSYRSNQGSYRGSGSNERSKTNSSYDGRRTQDTHDSDTRYGGVGGGTTAGRSVEKYERRGAGDGGRAVEYSHSYDRDTNDSLPARRRGAAQSSASRDTNARDGRKVVRERSHERRNVSSPDFRRPQGRSGTGARVEITREQSPPVRRSRRDGSPAPTRTLSTSRVAANARGASWRDSAKTTRDASRRGADDRDLREQIRGGRQESYSESSRDRGSQRNRATSHSASPPVRSSSQYQGRWPDNAADAQSQPIYSMNNEPSAIPTQTGRSGSSAAWGHVQQWQQSTGQGARTWPSATMTDPASAVTRQMLATAGYGGVPSAPATLIAPPGTTIIPASQGYIPSDRQSRSLQPGYNKNLVRRY